MCPVPSSAEHSPASVLVLGQSSARGAEPCREGDTRGDTRADSELSAGVTHSLGLIFLYGEVQQTKSGMNRSCLGGAVPSPAVLDLCAAPRELWAPEVTGVG